MRNPASGFPVGLPRPVPLVWVIPLSSLGGTSACCQDCRQYTYLKFFKLSSSHTTGGWGLMWMFCHLSVVTLRASCGAVYCNRSCLFVGGWVCYHGSSKLRASILTGCVQLIKFWPSRAPREGGLRRGENFWLRLRPTTASGKSAQRDANTARWASAQCLRLSERFFHLFWFHLTLLMCKC